MSRRALVMYCECLLACFMQTAIRICCVLESLHRRLTARLTLERLSISGPILQELEKALEHPVRSVQLDRIRSQPKWMLGPSPTGER